jgi:Porin subfamily
MNIKSFLLGSAIAVVAISSARAADAVVVAEPEPVEYVRVCDVYGTGFYYIPGTETCLKVSGYIRYDIGVGYSGYEDVIDKKDFAESGGLDQNLNDTYYKRARVALEIDARSETELGTLRAYSQINFQYDTITTEDDDTTAEIEGPFTSTENSIEIEHAYIELGGFLIGRTDSFFSTFGDYAGAVIQDDLIPYGPFQTHTIQYKFEAGNGFTAGVAVEEGADEFTLDSYVPHVAAGVKYAQDWGGVSAVAGYDSVWEEWAGKVRLDVNASETISLFVIGGFKSDDAVNFYGTWEGDWGVWGGFTAQLSPKASLNTQFSYDGAENFAAVANVEYELVPDFRITPEVVYVVNFDDEVDNDFDGGHFGGFVRFSAISETRTSARLADPV